MEPRAPVRLQSAGSIDVSMESGHRVVKFADSVVFDYAGYHLTAGRMTLDESVGRAWADGGVRLWGPAGYAKATRVWFELATERIVLEDFDARVGPWSAQAARAEFLGERIELYDAKLTACPTPYPIYSLRAKKLSKESRLKYVARGVVPYFYFVPIFYLPKYTQELEEQEEGDTLVPSRQGFEFNPGRGNFSGLFVKTAWRKKFLDKRLLSILHLDYYSKPGPAIGEELQYRSRRSEHLTYTYFSHPKKINRNGGYSTAPGHETRWRAWQIWTRHFSGGHFKTFVNEASDSNFDDDYRLSFEERKLREREISTEFVFDRPNLRLKFLGERLMSLDPGGPREYRVDRRLQPGLQVRTFPIPLAREKKNGTRGIRSYGYANALIARGKERADRVDGVLGSAEVAGIVSAPIGRKLSVTGELGLLNDYREKKISSESAASAQSGRAKITFHRPLLSDWLQTDWGYSARKAWTNKSLYSPNGFQENRLFLSLANFRRIWKTSFDAGYDFRGDSHGLSNLDFQTRVDGSVVRLGSIFRYDPLKNRMQSIYANASFSINPPVVASLGFQTVRTDSEVQVQFTPSILFELKKGEYRFGINGLYDSKLTRWRSRDFFLTKQFSCVETTFRASRRDSDLQFSLSFRLTGFGHPDESLPRSGFGGSLSGPSPFSSR